MSPEAPKVPTLDQAQQEVREIWLRFWRRGQTTENARERTERLAALLIKLPAAVSDELTAESREKTSLLAQIRDQTRLQELGERHASSRIKKIQVTTARRRNRR